VWFVRRMCLPDNMHCVVTPVIDGSTESVRQVGDLLYFICSLNFIKKQQHVNTDKRTIIVIYIIIHILYLVRIRISVFISIPSFLIKIVPVCIYIIIHI